MTSAPSERGWRGKGLGDDLFTGQNKNNTRYVQGELLIIPIFGELALAKKAQIPKDERGDNDTIELSKLSQGLNFKKLVIFGGAFYMKNF